MTLTRRSFALLAATFLTLASPAAQTAAQAADASPDGAKQFIDSLSSEAMQSLATASTPRPQRIEKFRHLFNTNFDVRGIGQWILGRYWPSATDDEKKEYLTLFEDLMVASYVDRFARYTGDLKIGQATKSTSDSTYIVNSRIDNPSSGQPVRVDWRVVPMDGGWKIVDVVVEGTSMSTTLRSEFGSIINQKGGKVSGLNEALREKTKTLKE
jgi:phospholipid transport system substrate-binding protein